MDDSPVEQIQSASGVSQTAEETVKEYVTRVGDEHDVESELLDDALSYVTEYYYSPGAPENERRFETFLSELGDGSEAATVDPEGVSSEETPKESDDEDNEITSAPRTTPVVDPPAAATGRGVSDFKTGIQGKEPRKLLLRFLVIVVTAPVVGWMFARAWVPGNTIYDQGRDLLVQLLGLPGTDATKLFVVFSFGLYLGLLVLFTIDVKKRVQAMLLWLGTILTIGVAATVGWVIPRVAATQLNVLGFLIGVVAGIAIEADQLRALDIEASSFRRPTLSNGALPEFRYAAGLLFVLLSLVTAATLAQVILAGTVQVYDVAVTAVFLGVVFQFVNYESETNYITLGPERSGKSMLMLGLCLTLMRNDVRHPNPNDYLQNTLERASNLQPGQETWPIPSTAHDELKAASFEVISGYYFPRRLELTALDYAGQHLARIAELIETDESHADESVPARVVDWIDDTDTLLFILDVERLVYPEEFHDGTVDDETISWGLEHYTTLADGTDPEDTIVVATKCDILIDQGVVDPPQSYDTYDAFREAVTDYLSSRPDVKELLATADESTIHPVYFVTERRDTTYVPYLDDDQNLVPVGYDHLIDEMRQRQ